ncbi:MAG: hypothetical protein JW951_02295 [Lentisphaerae bacterium]|nr:hypothetical protein [Lentisphaerota bacterium]
MSLAATTILLGAVLCALYLPLAAAPARARAWLVRFPRSRWPGRILTAADLIWAAWLLQQMPLGRFDRYKPLLYLLTPLTYGLIIALMDELLSPRALGGLLVLVPAALLRLARWHPSPWRLVVVVLAYAMAVKGILLILAPYRFRLWSERLLSTDRACRAWGGLGLAVGLLLLVLGAAVY